MKVLGFRFCSVSAEAKVVAEFLDALGLPRRSLADFPELAAAQGFVGAIFPAGDSWIELWPEGPDMPVSSMVQIIVDDAEAFARQAKANGLDPQGPMDAHGERVYFLTAPDGSSFSFQSRLPGAAG